VLMFFPLLQSIISNQMRSRRLRGVACCDRVFVILVANDNINVELFTNWSLEPNEITSVNDKQSLWQSVMPSFLWSVSQPVCSRLWCTNPHNEKAGCKTQHMPWADGTICSNPGAKETKVSLSTSSMSFCVIRCAKNNIVFVVLCSFIIRVNDL